MIATDVPPARRAALCALTFIFAFATAVAAAPDTFLKSDDYKEGEEVVKVFLMDDDYAKMIDDVERNDVDFDWAWVKSADGKMKAKPKKLGFDLRGAKSVTIPEIRKFHKGMVPDALLAAARESLVQAFAELGLEAVASDGDVTFEAVLVDYKKDSTFAYFATINPFIEVEARLTDNRTGEVWMLIRDQTHGDDAEGAAFNFADSVLRFLQ